MRVTAQGLSAFTITLLVLCGAGPVFAERPPGGVGCTKTATITSTDNNQPVTSITANPARVCSASFIASGANGWAEVFDSPDTTDDTHAQAKRVAEPGAAVAGDSANEYFGETGRPAYFGLAARVYRGRLIVNYAD